MPGHPGWPEYIENDIGKYIDQRLRKDGHIKDARMNFKDFPIVSIVFFGFHSFSSLLHAFPSFSWFFKISPFLFEISN